VSDDPVQIVITRGQTGLYRITLHGHGQVLEALDLSSAETSKKVSEVMGNLEPVPHIDLPR
jgi:hypothetical protein